MGKLVVCVGFEVVMEMEMKTEGGRLLCSSCFVGESWGGGYTRAKQSIVG